MKAKDLKIAAETYHRVTKGAGYGLTVWSWPGLTAPEIARGVGTEKMPQGMMRRSTVGAVLDAGYTLTETGGAGHLTLGFSAPPTDTDWKTLRKIFERAQVNPVGERAVNGR